MSATVLAPQPPLSSSTTPIRTSYSPPRNETSLMHEEWNIPDPETPLNQGDILICRDPHKGVIESIRLVITADCDISQSKFGTHLACLRIVTFQEYLRSVWADKKLRRNMEKELEKLRAQLNKWNVRRLPGAIVLSPEVVVNWVRHSEPDAISRDLEIPEPDATKVTANIALFRSAIQVLDAKGSFDSFAKLVAFRSALSKVSHDDCRRDLVTQAQGEVLPEDIFLLPSLPQLDLGSAVVLLREIIGIPTNLVCFRTTDASSNEHFLRIGTLEPTFKYAVSQAFGTLYSRIGLPEAYEARCETVIEQLATFTWE